MSAAGSATGGAPLGGPGAKPPHEEAGAARAISEARSILKPLRRLLDAVIESPVAESDARDLLASWRIGLWIGLLVALVALSAFVNAGYYFAGERGYLTTVGKNGLGALLVASLQGATLGFLTLAIPVRASGLLEGPRWRGYFDQLVASGIAPWRYFAGRALAAQALIALAFAGTLPVLAIFFLIDPPPLGRVLEGYLLIIIFAETLLAVSLALCILLHEFVAVPLTIAIASLIHFLATLPLPSTLVAISPCHYIVAPFFLGAAQGEAARFELLYGNPMPFGIEVPYLPYVIALSLAFVALSAVPCGFGPLHAFVPGFNNFGAVVISGDRTRTGLRRFRPILSRRAELAFFFENRGPLLDQFAPWMRLAAISGFLLLLGTVFVAGLANTTIWTQFLGGSVDESDLAASVPICLSAVYFLGPWIFATGKNDAHASLRFGPLRIPVIAADLAAYAFVLACLSALLLLSLTTLIPVMSVRHVSTPVQALLIAAEWCGVLGVVSFTGLVMQKWLGLRTHSRAAGALIATVALCLVPLVLAARSPSDFRDLNERELRSETENARGIAALHVAWPLRLGLSVRDEKLDDIRLPKDGAWRWLAYNGFWAIYPGFDLLILGAIAVIVRKRRREAETELDAIARAGSAR
jgi:hypothetical protein